MCPTCRAPMIVVELDGVEVDHCLACHGVWLDSGELELLIEIARSTPGRLHAALGAAAAGPAGPRRCPRCWRKLRALQVGDTPAVTLDRCPAGHGLWFDAGELATIVRHYADGAEAQVTAFLGDLVRHGLSTQPERGTS